MSVSEVTWNQVGWTASSSPAWAAKVSYAVFRVTGFLDP